VASSVISKAEGERIFVIGDIHGCVDEPAAMLTFLQRDEKLTSGDAVVFLGDYIDRGSASRQVIDLVLNFKAKFPNTYFMKGNHEDMLMDFLGFEGRLGQAFLYNGGLETIQSYGISVFAAAHEMRAAFPKSHLDFFEKLLSVLSVDKYLCVHAGLNPLRDLDSQNDGDVLWIRDEFIANVHSFNQTVIFGHTPYKEVLLHLPYKIGIDTGLVFGNKLSCLELKSGKLLQVARGGSSVVRSRVDVTVPAKQ
jgi:serine/threonine protein phosphatase 1